MQSLIAARSFVALPLVAFASSVLAGDAVTLENVVDPGPNRTEEAVADFSLARAANFLDSASLQWQKQRKCVTCHTNMAYLVARPGISSAAPAHRQVRAFVEQLVGKRWQEKGPRWDAEVVVAAMALASNDAATTQRLHPLSRTALDRMWTVQRDDGGWDWLKCDWPPMESDDHFGVTLAAIATGVAPDDYANTESARRGLDGIRAYLKNNPPPTLHHRAMILWASSYVDGLASDAANRSTVENLLALQKQDGGWAVATLGDWGRMDDEQQDTVNSDGYGTGFVIYVLRRAGLPADSAAIGRGIEWLKTHQRESGRWYTRSLSKDNKHFLSHAGTAMAVMALAACGESE